MKKHLVWMILVFSILGTTVLDAGAKDMRALSMEAEKARKILMEKAAREEAEARAEAAEKRRRITRDRSALEHALADLEAENNALEKQAKGLADELAALEVSEKELSGQLVQASGEVRELVGVIRVNAKDLDTRITQDPRTGLDENPPSYLADLAGESRFPGMADVRNMVSALQNLIRSYSEVVRTSGQIVDRSGREKTAEILFLGPFTACYRMDREVGFLNHSPAGGRLFALSRLPSSRIQKQIRAYMDGETDAIPMDITRGGALRQMTHQLSLKEQIPKGGPIVWPILGILALGILIILERVFFLLRKNTNADALLRRIEAALTQNDWEGCARLCAKLGNKPVARVLSAGLACRRMEREEMENTLQEAILKEIPAMDRFLSTLGMLAAIAPLLGLLGTVTGMIDTFHVITLYGTGDPRLMSGGISEALVTTMLGLSVAIPLMLAHTLLSRAADKRIGQMEEKAVALVNVIYKTRGTA